MEYFIPILFAVIKKSVAALLVAAFIFLARRGSDWALGINFKKEWDEASEKTKFTFINISCYLFHTYYQRYKKCNLLSSIYYSFIPYLQFNKFIWF